MDALTLSYSSKLITKTQFDVMVNKVQKEFLSLFFSTKLLDDDNLDLKQVDIAIPQGITIINIIASY